MEPTIEKQENVHDGKSGEVHQDGSPHADDNDSGRMLNEQNAGAMKSIMQRFVDSYRDKDENVSDEEWLTKHLQEELPNESPSTVQAMSHDIISSVSDWNESIRSVNDACGQGLSKEAWLADRLQEAAVGQSVDAYGQHLAEMGKTLHESNAALMETITTRSGNINMNPNLDGFIAEQAHVNSFNQNAALRGSSYRAEVLKPKPGEAYGKNSVDIVIRETSSNKIVCRYQCKYGADSKSTFQLFEKGNGYPGQEKLTPDGQAEDVTAKLREKGSRSQAVDRITAPDGTQSEPVSKEQVMKLRDLVQEGKEIPGGSWNSYNTRNLALHIGKEVVFAGVAGAATAAGVHIAMNVLEGEEVNANEVVDAALIGGIDRSIKCSAASAQAIAAGALTVSAKKGLVPVLARATTGVIAYVAAAGIENVKVVDQFMSGELTGREALEAIGRNTCAVFVGLEGAGAGASIGALIGSVIPVVGTFIGTVIGGMIGYFVGSGIGKALAEAASKLGEMARSLVSGLWKGICDTGKGLISGIFNGIESFFSSIFG